MILKNKLIIILFLVFLSAGCASIPKTTKVIQKEPLIEPQEEKISEGIISELQNIQDKDLESYVQKKGVVFGKSDFQGVLKASYVKLILEHKDDSMKKFQLYIWEKSEQNSLSQEIKAFYPGYFFIELPIGHYKMSSVSIPVGSTLASEDMDIEFEVVPESITYIGTLRMIGTKERIRLGGVPVIKPGFEYSVEILDENKEAKEIFHQNYPNVTNNILEELMKINPK